MKKLLLLLGTGVIFSFTANAQTTDPSPEQPVLEQQQQHQQDEHRKRLMETEIPQEVMKGFSDSEYGTMTIAEAYMISGAEANRIIKDVNQKEIQNEEGSQYKDVRPEVNEEFNNEEEDMENPETEISSESVLYELRVQDNDKMATLFFTEAGELLSVGEEMGVGK